MLWIAALLPWKVNVTFQINSKMIDQLYLNCKKNKEIISETSYLHWLKWMRLCQTYNLFAPFRQTFGNETTVRRNNCTFDSFRIHVIVQQCFISAFEKVLFHLKSKQLSTCEIRKIILHWDLRYFQSNQPYLKKSTVQLVTC